MSLLAVEDLRVEFPSRRGAVVAVERMSLEIEPGEILGIVGESGAGKSTIGNAILGLLEPPGQVTSGRMRLHERDLGALAETAAEEAAWGDNRDDLPGSADLAQSAVHRRATARRDDSNPSRSLGVGGGGAGRAPSRPGRHRRAAGSAPALPAPVLRRNAPAGGDRAGAVRRSRTADRRRAHDCPRRLHPGPDPGAHPHALPGAPARRGAHHAQYGRHRRHHRSGPR